MSLPSSANIIGEPAQVEIHQQKRQAHWQIVRLRDIIADISFQYSHVIQGTIRRSVRATAQKRIKSLQNELVLHARIYSHCRTRLIALQCDERWLRIFRVLTRSDLKASTAILQPNLPGSSSLKLSWIWQTGRWYLFNSDANHVADADAEGHEQPDATSLLECG